MKCPICATEVCLFGVNYTDLKKKYPFHLQILTQEFKLIRDNSSVPFIEDCEIKHHENNDQHKTLVKNSSLKFKRMECLDKLSLNPINIYKKKIKKNRIGVEALMYFNPEDPIYQYTLMTAQQKLLSFSIQWKLGS